MEEKDKKPKVKQKSFLEQSIDDFGIYIWDDVVMPGLMHFFEDSARKGLKKLSDGILDGLHTALFKDETTRASINTSDDRRRTYHNYVSDYRGGSYDDYYDSFDSYDWMDDTRTRHVRHERVHGDTNNEYMVEFRTADDAKEFVSKLKDRLRIRGKLTIPDVYDICGEETANWASENYGWKNLDTIRTRYSVVMGAYIVTLPRPVQV